MTKTGIRMLKDNIDDGSVIIHGRKSSISQVIVNSAVESNFSKEVFIHGWTRRPQHGETKCHKYMSNEHKIKIFQYFVEDKKRKARTCQQH